MRRAAGDRDDLDAARTVRLIAARELTVRLRSKAFRITTAAAVVLLVGLAIVMKLALGHQSVERVGLTGGTASLAVPLEQTARSLGVNVRVSVVRSVAAGRTQVRDGHLAALVTGGGGRLVVTVNKSLDSGLQGILGSLVQRQALNEQIARLGGDPAQVNRAVASATVRVTKLAPPPKFDPQRLAVGSVVGILVYLALMFTGQWVAIGVVEEKSSRVVELLLSTVRTWHLMAGKVLGIGTLGLIWVVIVGGAGALAALATGALSISASVVAGSLGWLLVWFVLGFVTYALIFAGLGALVSRQEDVGGVVAPATICIIVGYVIGISILPTDPSNGLVAVLSVIPLFSPTLMPMRIAIGAAPVWQVILALALSVAMIPSLIWLTSRIYRGAVMRVGARVRLRDALRAT